MSDPITDALQLRADALRAKLSAREGQPGFSANADEIRSAIEVLEGEVERRKSGAELPKAGVLLFDTTTGKMVVEDDAAS